MIAQGEYVHALKSANYRIFMFSGSGNDVLGDLTRHLNQRISGDNDVANAPRYIKDSFNDTLDRLLDLYEGMIAKVAQISPKTKIFIHVYAYATAQVNGHWLGNAFTFKGFDPVDDAAMCSAITRAMVDAFNVRLSALASANKKRVTYMDLRKDVKKNEWWMSFIHARQQRARWPTSSLRRRNCTFQRLPQRQAIEPAAAVFLRHRRERRLRFACRSPSEW